MDPTHASPTLAASPVPSPAPAEPNKCSVCLEAIDVEGKALLQRRISALTLESPIRSHPQDIGLVHDVGTFDAVCRALFESNSQDLVDRFHTGQLLCFARFVNNEPQNAVVLIKSTDIPSPTSPTLPQYKVLLMQSRAGLEDSTLSLLHLAGVQLAGQGSTLIWDNAPGGFEVGDSWAVVSETQPRRLMFTAKPVCSQQFGSFNFLKKKDAVFEWCRFRCRQCWVLFDDSECPNCADASTARASSRQRTGGGANPDRDVDHPFGWFPLPNHTAFLETDKESLVCVHVDVRTGETKAVSVDEMERRSCLELASILDREKKERLARKALADLECRDITTSGSASSAEEKVDDDNPSARSGGGGKKRGWVDRYKGSKWL